MAEAKSKRDLIWEQKKKMREQQQRGQNGTPFPSLTTHLPSL